MGGGISLTRKHEQALRVDAIEGYGGNVSPIYDCVYDRRFVGDIREVLPSLTSYDVVICSHVIEHFEKDEAWRLIGLMRERAKAAVVLGLPFGEWPQDEVDGNALEVHRSTWHERDFRGPDVLVKRFGRGRRRSGLVVWGQNDHARWLVKGLGNPFLSLARRCACLCRGTGNDRG